jgi:hypothetical protein
MISNRQITNKFNAMKTQNKGLKAEKIAADRSDWTLIFIITTITIVFAFGIVFFSSAKINLLLNTRTAIATIIIGLGAIYTFKIKNSGLEIDYRALFFVSLLLLANGFIFNYLAMWCVSIIFLSVSLINFSRWKNEQKWSELPDEVKKVKLILIITITLLFIIGIILLIVSNKIEAYQRRLRNNYAALSIYTSQNSLPLEKKYINSDYNFSFAYPSEDSANNNFQYQFATNNTLVRIDLPAKYYSDTNLGEAAFIVGASRQPSIIASCTVPVLGEEKLGLRTISGSDFTAFYSLEPAAGNRYETISYRTVKNDICYEVIEFLHWGEISNYTPGAVKEFDHNLVIVQLDRILSTFKL